MEIVLLFGLIALLSIGALINLLRTDAKLSKLEREIDDLKQPTVKAEDLLTALERASHNTFNRN